MQLEARDNNDICVHIYEYPKDYKTDIPKKLNIDLSKYFADNFAYYMNLGYLVIHYTYILYIILLYLVI